MSQSCEQTISDEEKYMQICHKVAIAIYFARDETEKVHLADYHLTN